MNISNKHEKKNTHTHTTDYEVAEVKPNRQCMKRMWRLVWVCIDDVCVCLLVLVTLAAINCQPYASMGFQVGHIWECMSVRIFLAFQLNRSTEYTNYMHISSYLSSIFFSFFFHQFFYRNISAYNCFNSFTFVVWFLPFNLLTIITNYIANYSLEIQRLFLLLSHSRTFTHQDDCFKRLVCVSFKWIK